MKKKQEFDPSLFLKSCGISGTESFKQVLLSHSNGLFELFKKMHPIPGNADEEEIGTVFIDFINYVTIDSQMSYSLLGMVIHLYLTIWSGGRVFATCNSYWSLFHTARIPTLTEFTGKIQFLYYLLLWIPYPTINQFISYYGTIITGSSLWMTFFLIRTDFVHVLNWGNKDGYYSWNAVYIPVIYFAIFTFSYARQISLSCWIWATDRDYYFTDGEYIKSSRILNIIKLINLWTWKIVYMFMPLLSVWMFWLTRPSILVESDLIFWPSTISLMIYSSIITAVFTGWLTFLTFQIQFIIWEKEWKSGIVVMNYGSDINIGVIY